MTLERAEPGTFKALAPAIDLPSTERSILNFWEENSIFAKTIAAREGSPRWTFYEGPPTANGKPGTHHIEARVFKDLFPRYQTMKGNQVIRKAGWDCHGLQLRSQLKKSLVLAARAISKSMASLPSMRSVVNQYNATSVNLVR
jgi:isoleucyl-tRNA synthetase